MRSFTKSEFKKAWTQALVGTANDFVNELVRTAPVDTGNLRNTIKYEVHHDTVEISMPNYAYHVEFGTRPHIIRAKNAKALHWKKGGHDFFAKVVHHPGSEPQPFIRNAITGKLKKIFYENLKRQLT